MGWNATEQSFMVPVNFFDAEITGGVSLTGAIIGGRGHVDKRIFIVAQSRAKNVLLTVTG